MRHRHDAVLAVVRDSSSLGEMAADYGVTRASLAGCSATSVAWTPRQSFAPTEELFPPEAELIGESTDYRVNSRELASSRPNGDATFAPFLRRLGPSSSVQELAHVRRERRLGRRGEAAAFYEQALELTANAAERSYLRRRLEELGDQWDRAQSRETARRYRNHNGLPGRSTTSGVSLRP